MGNKRITFLPQVFDLDKQIPDVTANNDGSDRLMSPVCLRTTKGVTSDSQLPSKVTCVTVDDTLTSTAVGFDDGSLVVYRGELGRDRQGLFLDAWLGNHTLTMSRDVTDIHGKRADFASGKEGVSLLIIYRFIFEGKEGLFALSPAQKALTKRQKDLFLRKRTV